jgi:thioesterase domain-containing protein
MRDMCFVDFNKNPLIVYILSCSYLELAGSLRKDLTVFALDDGALLSGRPFRFDSIQQVAEACFDHVLEVARDYGLRTESSCEERRTILLGGWSYGGVVAVEIAKLVLSRKRQLKSVDNPIEIEVASIVLFDSPLRQPKRIHELSEADGSSSNRPAYRDLIDATGSSGDIQVVARTAEHFTACTALLSKYHGRAAESKSLSCPIVDVRPDETDYLCDLSAIEELTVAVVHRPVVRGSHWTMLFGQFVDAVAAIVHEQIDRVSSK